MGAEHETFVDLLQWRARQTPKQQAYTFLVDGDADAVHLTYEELDHRARAIGARLQSMGAAGERALLLYPPGLDYIAAFFGCMYAGVIAVPAYPPQRKRTLPRLQSILENSQSRFALTTVQIHAHVQRLCSQDPGLEDLRKPHWFITEMPAGEDETGWRMPEIDGGTLAFLQYTSGSTGTPKGVMVSHGNLLDNERMIAQAFDHTARTIVLGWLPLYHDMGLIGNVLQPLYLGVPCVLMSPTHFLQQPFRWLAAISRYRATTSGGPNFAYDLCVRHTTAEQRASLDLSCWTVAFNGAEPIHPGTLERFTQSFNGSGFRREAFYPCYGLAEATLLVSGGDRTIPPMLRSIQKAELQQHRILMPTEPHEETQALVGCGHARLEQQICIVNPESLRICPAGHVGEVWVKGPSIAQGYWNRPEETAQTFEGYTSDTSEGPFLRTGDLGFMEDDELFITGRLKDLIIIRGRNHYPHDIELTAQWSHPSLRPEGGAAFSIERHDGEQLVVVHEVEARRSSFDGEAVIAAIRQAVAEQHEVQVYAVVLIKPGTLPKTSSGKVQRHRCRSQFLAGELSEVVRNVAQEQDLEKSRSEVFESPIEKEVAEVWARILECKQIDIHDNFFSLGGDSLRGMQILARLQQIYHVELSLDSLFDHPTVAELAGCIETHRAAVSIAPASPLKSIPRDVALPLSFSQERFWFLEQMSPGSAFGNIPIALRLIGPLDVVVLGRALNEIVRRHEILRAACVVANSQPVHTISPRLDILPSMEDLRGLSEHRREEEAWRAAMEEAARPFDLAKGPLLRHRLFRLGEDDHLLSLTIHHIVADGWSMHILSRELGVLYEALLDGRPSPLPNLTIQYIDTVIHRRHWTQGTEWKRQLSYWKQQLDHTPHTLSLPTDFSRQEVQGHRGARHSWTMEAEVLQQLRAIGHRYQATLFMTLLAAFQILLYRHSGQSDFCVGTPVANRTRPEYESIIGCFVNTVALRADLSGNPSFHEFLSRVRKAVLGAHANQDIPFEQLVDELRVPRDLGHTPLFQVMFVLEESPSEVLTLHGLDVRRIKVNTQTSVFDLTLEMEQKTDGTLDATFEYSTDVFGSHTISRMADHLQQLLHSIAAFPESNVSELSFLTDEERRYVLDRCNDTQDVYPQELCLHQLFETQAMKTPDAVALLCGGCTYTYAFVNNRANQLARYLQSRGVSVETPVGLCVERSLEMVVGLLGCLKAGAAYVPIDPLYPRERQSSILNDVRPRLVLTQERCIEHLPERVAPVLSLDRDWAAVARFDNENLSSVMNPQNLAYVLYTSGTTGQPKGTGISHRALVNHSTAMVKQYGLCRTDRVLQFASFSFDVAAEECFPTWLAGATVVMRPNEPIPTFSDFQQFVDDHGLTVLNLPTPYWAAWTEDIERTGLQLPSSIRLVIVGSEKALPDFLVRWQRVAGDRIDWCNAYGPTEATITASSYAAEPAMDWTNVATVPIGRPITNVQLYVLDPYSHPVPIGVPGELCIGGHGLARGYQNLPAATAEKFIPHPFSQEAGARLYRTGDRVRRRTDGNVEFLGRRDDQVKIRGFRVELSDIESHLRQHAHVAEAAVLLESPAPLDWPALIGGLSEPEQDRMLKEIESLTAAEAQWIYDLESDAEERRKTVIQRKPEFDVYLKINKEEFVNPPQKNQRNWLLRRALDEFSDDLCELDAVSKRFVSGSERAGIERSWTGSRAEYTPSELIIEGQQVMQDWEEPLMKAMAEIVTESKGDIVEVGFGMGISASYIQEGCPRSHSIIECNHDVIKAFTEWKHTYPGRDIRLLQGRWQEVVESLQEYDGVFFDTYPTSEEEFEQSVINSINFAEAFIPAAAKLLRPGGVFTYYTNEIDSFSRRHQRLLLRHFSSFTLSIVRSLVPPEDCHYWWADSMAVVKAVK